jgi:hypothetical protein
VNKERAFGIGAVWSHLSLRKVGRVFLWCFAVVLTSTIALRVEAAIYASRIVSVVTALSTLLLETSKAETSVAITNPSAFGSDALRRLSVRRRRLFFCFLSSTREKHWPNWTMKQIANSLQVLERNGGDDGTRTRGLCRDSLAFLCFTTT